MEDPEAGLAEDEARERVPSLDIAPSHSASSASEAEDDPHEASGASGASAGSEDPPDGESSAAAPAKPAYREITMDEIDELVRNRKPKISTAIPLVPPLYGGGQRLRMVVMPQEDFDHLFRECDGAKYGSMERPEVVFHEVGKVGVDSTTSGLPTVGGPEDDPFGTGGALMLPHIPPYPAPTCPPIADAKPAPHSGRTAIEETPSGGGADAAGDDVAAGVGAAEPPQDGGVDAIADGDKQLHSAASTAVSLPPLNLTGKAGPKHSKPDGDRSLGSARSSHTADSAREEGKAVAVTGRARAATTATADDTVSVTSSMDREGENAGGAPEWRLGSVILLWDPVRQLYILSPRTADALLMLARTGAPLCIHRGWFFSGDKRYECLDRGNQRTFQRFLSVHIRPQLQDDDLVAALMSKFAVGKEKSKDKGRGKKKKRSKHDKDKATKEKDKEKERESGGGAGGKEHKKKKSSKDKDKGRPKSGDGTHGRPKSGAGSGHKK